jgi:proteasome activator subunit 4
VPYGSCLIVALSRNSLGIIAHLEPDLIIPGVLKRFYPSMQGLLEAHRTTASLATLSILMPTIARHKIYRNHATTLLGLAIPGIDPNDLSKTTLTLTFMISTCMLIPLWDLSDEGDHTAMASDWISSQMEILENMTGDDYPLHPNEEGELVSVDPARTMTEAQSDLVARSSTGSLGEWVTAFFTQIFGFLSNMPDSHKTTKTAEEVMVPMITLAVSTVLQALEPKLFTLALKKMQRFITENVFHNAGEATAGICRCFVEVQPEETLEAFLGPVVACIREEIVENGAGKSGRITTTEVLPRDRTLLWHLRIFFAVIGPRTGSAVLRYLDGPNPLIKHVIELTARECKGTIYYYVGKSLVNVISSLTGIYTLGQPLVKKDSEYLSLHD